MSSGGFRPSDKGGGGGVGIPDPEKKGGRAWSPLWASFCSKNKGGGQAALDPPRNEY